MRKVLVTLDTKQLEKIDQLKVTCLTSRSQIVRDVIRLYLDHYARDVKKVDSLSPDFYWNESWWN